jgi:hypothetical protein
MNHQKFWSGFCRRFRSKTADFKTLLKELGDNFPCSKKWFKRETWEMDNAILIYNNIEIEELGHQGTISQSEIIEAIKFSDDDDLHGNLFNYLNPHHSPFDFDHITTISVSDFLEFLKNKCFKIPAHFPKELFDSNRHQDEQTTQTTKQGEIDGKNLKRLVKSFDLKKMTVNELGILQARILAAALWKNDETLSQIDIIDSDEFIEVMQHFYGFTGLSNAEEKEMKQEWISDLDPRENKPGRKKKQQ